MTVGKVIAFASTKGGVGKSTNTLAVAQTFCHLFAQSDVSIAIIDTDRASFIIDWATDNPTRVPSNMEVIQGNDHKTLYDVIEDASRRHNFVFIDYEGTANQAFSATSILTDLVIVPLRPNKSDVKGALTIAALLEQQRAVLPGMKTQFRLLYNFTRGAINPVSGRQYKALLDQNGVKAFHMAARLTNIMEVMQNEGYQLFDMPARYKKSAVAPQQNYIALANEIALVLQNDEVTEDDLVEMRRMVGEGDTPSIDNDDADADADANSMAAE